VGRGQFASQYTVQFKGARLLCYVLGCQKAGFPGGARGSSLFFVRFMQNPMKHSLYCIYFRSFPGPSGHFSQHPTGKRRSERIASVFVVLSCFEVGVLSSIPSVARQEGTSSYSGPESDTVSNGPGRTAMTMNTFRRWGWDTKTKRPLRI
jgi:hypothetical protein